MSWTPGPEWSGGGRPSGVARSLTGSMPGTGRRSNLGNLMRMHMRGLNINTIQRSRVAARYIYNYARQLTWERGKIASRRYYDGWTYTQHPTGARVSNPTPHATVIETGRAAGTYPPEGRIRNWIMDKGHAGMGGFGGLYAWMAATRSSGADRRFNQLTWMVQSAIHDRGTPADPIMGESARLGREHFARLLIHTLLYYNAGAGRVTFPGVHRRAWEEHLFFQDSYGRSQRALPGASGRVLGDPAPDFARAWQQMGDHIRGGDIWGQIDSGIGPDVRGPIDATGAPTGDLPGRDY